MTTNFTPVFEDLIEITCIKPMRNGTNLEKKYTNENISSFNIKWGRKSLFEKNMLRELNATLRIKIAHAANYLNLVPELFKSRITVRICKPGSSVRFNPLCFSGVIEEVSVKKILDRNNIIVKIFAKETFNTQYFNQQINVVYSDDVDYTSGKTTSTINSVRINPQKPNTIAQAINQVRYRLTSTSNNPNNIQLGVVFYGGAEVENNTNSITHAYLHKNFYEKMWVHGLVNNKTEMEYNNNGKVSYRAANKVIDFLKLWAESHPFGTLCISPDYSNSNKNCTISPGILCANDSYQYVLMDNYSNYLKISYAKFNTEYSINNFYARYLPVSRNKTGQEVVDRTSAERNREYFEYKNINGNSIIDNFTYNEKIPDNANLNFVKEISTSLDLMVGKNSNNGSITSQRVNNDWKYVQNKINELLLYTVAGILEVNIVFEKKQNRDRNYDDFISTTDDGKIYLFNRASIWYDPINYRAGNTLSEVLRTKRDSNGVSDFIFYRDIGFRKLGGEISFNNGTLQHKMIMQPVYNNVNSAKNSMLQSFKINNVKDNSIY